jgi:hypothetical protein
LLRRYANDLWLCSSFQNFRRPAAWFKILVKAQRP